LLFIDKFIISFSALFLLKIFIHRIPAENIKQQKLKEITKKTD